MDLKKSTKSNQKPFEDLCDKIRLIIDNMGKDVVNKVEVKIFEGVNDNINKIGKPKMSLKQSQVQFQNLFTKMLFHILIKKSSKKLWIQPLKK